MMNPREQMSVSKQTIHRDLMQAISLLFSAILWMGLSMSCANAGIVLTTLVSFNVTNGMQPDAGVVQGTDGNYYGTTPLGGTNSGNGHGTIFRITPTGVLTKLHSFSGHNDGDNPIGGIAQGTDGYFYGTTFAGGATNYNLSIGAYGYGTVFKITTNGTLTTLYAFTNGLDGGYPAARLVLGKDGNFYGTTTKGGSYGSSASASGTIFKVKTNGKLTTIYRFPTDPLAYPHAPLVQGADGNLYGSAPGTGAYDWGFLFKVTTNGTLLWRVTFSGDCQINCGCLPYGGLLQGKDGNFYGTTEYGGNGYQDNGGPSYRSGYGTFFKVTTNGTLTTLFLFNNTNGPYSPSSTLALGSDGNFYGTTERGGVNSKGTVFQVIGTNVKNLLSFNGANGGGPSGPLVQGSDGDFYGTTVSGGAYSHGTVFRLSVPIPPVFQTIAKTGSVLKLTWNAVAGQTYQLQYKTNVIQTHWINLGTTNIATNAIISASDTTASDRQRFYRVTLLP